jgi:hypothetical protein
MKKFEITPKATAKRNIDIVVFARTGLCGSQTPSTS